MNCGGRLLPIKNLSTKHLLICEGTHDKEFFKHLILARSIPADFTIVGCSFASGQNASRDGIEKLTEALDELPTLAGFYDVLQSILIVADNDDNPAEKFNKVVDLINETSSFGSGQRFSAPTAPQVTSAGNNPRIVVYMMPAQGVKGALDLLCWQAAAGKRPEVAGYVETFADSCGANTWTEPKDSKMKLRSLIAGAYSSDPYLSPTYVWNDGTDLVPLNHSAFDAIDAFLRNFPNLV